MAKSKKNAPDLSPATFVDPVRFTTVEPISRELKFSYFYNGNVVYGYCHNFPWRFQRFPELTPETVKTTTWGIQDENYAVIGLQLLEVKPKRCRRIGKYAHFYFLIDGQVFSPNEVNPDTWFPQLPDGNALERSECLQQWFDTHFTLKWQRHRSSPRLYQLVAFGLQLCREICEENEQESAKLAMADQGIKLYERFKDYAWLMPELLHSAACLYAIRNKAELVASCCEKALGYRYEHSQTLLAEPVIKACLSLSVLQNMQQRAKAMQPHIPYVSLELIEAYENVAGDAKDDPVFSKMLERHILYTWLYYSPDELRLFIAQEKGGQTYWRRLDERIYWYMQNLMLLDLTFMVPPNERQRIQSFIDAYYQHSYLNPVAIVSVAHDLFQGFHGVANWQETFFSEDGKRLPPSRKMLQSQALLELFNKHLNSLPRAQQQQYRTQAKNYFAYLLFSSS